MMGSSVFFLTSTWLYVCLFRLKRNCLFRGKGAATCYLGPQRCRKTTKSTFYGSNPRLWRGGGRRAFHLRNHPGEPNDIFPSELPPHHFHHVLGYILRIAFDGGDMNVAQARIP